MAVLNIFPLKLLFLIKLCCIYYDHLYVLYNMPQLVPFYFINQVLFEFSSIVNVSENLSIFALFLGIVFFSAVGLIPIQSLINEKNTPDRFNIDLYYEKRGLEAYIYDKVDATGSRLHSLVSGQNYGTDTLNGRSCVVVSLSGRNSISSGVRVVKLSALSDRAVEVERNSTILSRSMPVLRTSTRTGIVVYWIHLDN